MFDGLKSEINTFKEKDPAMRSSIEILLSPVISATRFNVLFSLLRGDTVLYNLIFIIHTPYKMCGL